MSHCIQYASIGLSSRIVFETENMTDEEIRMAAGATRYDSITRLDRCPECESWTTYKGELRKEIDCPAVQAALKGA